MAQHVVKKGEPTGKTMRGIVLQKGTVSVEKLPYPTFEIQEDDGTTRKCNHGVILKVLFSNICGSDMHMVRERTNAPPGYRLGHEITGEIVEKGPDVETLQIGDWVSVPFNVACGRCQNCIERNTQICLRTNSMQPGGAYGYVGMGPWPGGQAEYVMVPYADFNLLKLPKLNDKDKLLDMAFLSDILPTAYHGAIQGGVCSGKSVYIAGAGPVGLCCVASCKSMGAGPIFIGDFETARLSNAAKMGAITIDLNKEDPIQKIKSHLGVDTVDCSVDCVGFESCGHHGRDRRAPEQKTEVMNLLIKLTKYGGGIGTPGVYLPVPDPKATGEKMNPGIVPLDFGNAWNKGLFIQGGQCPVMMHNRDLLGAILNGRIEAAKFMNVELIGLEDAPRAYAEFNEGAAKKFIIDPHGIMRKMIGTPTTK